MSNRNSVLKEAFSTLHWRALDIVIIVVLITLSKLALEVYFFSWLGRVTQPFIATIAQFITISAFNVWLTLSMCELQKLRFYHEDMSAMNIVKKTFLRVPRAIPIMVVASTTTVIGFGLFFFPGLIAAVVFGYIYQVYYFDNENGLKALKYSARFVYENGLEAVLTVIIAALISIIGSYVITYLFSRLSPVSMSFITVLIGIVDSYCKLAVTQFYLRSRSEFFEEAVVNDI